MKTKEIQAVFQCETWKASRIRRILDGQIDLRIGDYHDTKLYSHDRDYERLLAIDHLLDCTFGIEGDSELEFSYLNTGDTYDTTIVLKDGEFFLSSWGDYYESLNITGD